MSVVSMKQLLESGVHFGHQTRRWNPKMAPYIFTERNGIYIIDLQKTVRMLDDAYMFVRDLSAAGESVLFVGDQIFTDCLAAHRAGIDCCLVRPIKAESSTFFKLKRFLEKPFLKTFFKSAKSRRCD